MSAGPPVTPAAAYQIDLFCIRQQMDTECPNISHIGGYALQSPAESRTM